MQQKSTHERRQHAMQVASVVTVFVFVGWLATFGMRLKSGAVANSGSGQTTQLANLISTQQVNTNTLEVATSTDDADTQ